MKYTDKMTKDQAEMLLSPTLAAFLPVLYVGWTNQTLNQEKSHMERIHHIIQQHDGLNESDKLQLEQWTDTAHPPSARVLRNWLGIIRQHAEHIAKTDEDALRELVDQIAQHSQNAHQETPIDSQTHQLLSELINELKISDSDTIDEMIIQDQRISSKIDTEPLPSFDIARLQAFLDRDQPEIKRQLRNRLSDSEFTVKHIRDKAIHRQKVFEWCKLLAEEGWGALAYPEAYGGKDDMDAYIAVFELLGYHDLSLAIKFGVQFGLWGGSIHNLGTERHHKAYLPDTGTLELPGCFAMTEAGHGSNVRDIETTATYDAQREVFVIHTPTPLAFKEYIGNAAVHGKMATVFAQLYTEGVCYGVHAFVVPIRDAQHQPMPGVRIDDSGDKLGLNGVDNGRLWFDHVEVPRANLLDRFASVNTTGAYSSPIASEARRFFTMLSTLVGGRVSVPLAALSAAKTGLTIAINYANKRRQFGPEGLSEIPIMEYPNHQRRLIPLLAKAYALDFGLKYVKDRYLNKSEEDIREVEALAAGIKAKTTWHTTNTLQECREACGGNGYLAVNRLADLKADTDIFTTFEGDNTVLMQLVAKGRLAEFKHRFSSMNFFGFVSYFGQQAATAISELNPITIRKTDSEHLRSFDFLMSAFEYRETRLVTAAARRIKHRIDNGMDSYDAFLETQTHLIAMAHAYMDRVILSSFISGIELVKDEAEKNVLIKICSLYGLYEIEQNGSWYLEKGYIEGSKSRAIRKEIDILCDELRSDSEALVAAFAIPDTCLAAPIALNYPDV